VKKIIVLSVMTAVILLVGSVFTPVFAQSPTSSDTSTFYRLVPGTYVNGYPRFTIAYPKDWAERPPFVERGGVFRVTPPGGTYLHELSILVNAYPAPLGKFSDLIMRTYKSLSVSATIVSDRTIRLPDGTQAQEVETTAIWSYGPRTEVAVGIKKGEWWTMITVASRDTRISDDLRAIPYSIKYEPDKDRPVTVPPDVQEFFDRFSSDVLSHDLPKVMSHFSDRYLNSGTRKGGAEQGWRQFIGYYTSNRAVHTDFVPAGDIVHTAGFVLTNLGALPTTNSIIKEDGEWKWYGNQRDVAP
jgi:hypothetical protein